MPIATEVEQRAICSYLNKYLAERLLAGRRIAREVELLREYRTRLIADIVTGKLDVREAAANLPDEQDEPEPLDAAGVETDVDEPAEDLDAEPEEAQA